MLTKRVRSASLPNLPTAIDLTDTLRAIPIFKGVDDHTLSHKIAPCLHLRLFRHGDLIVKEGERGQHLFILLSGTASVWSERQECRVAEMTQGAVFGEIAVLYDQTRTVSVRLSSATGKVAVLSRQDLMEALKDDEHLLQRLRERAKAHLQSDLQSFGKHAEPVIVSQELLKSAFVEFAEKSDDLLRLLLIDSKGYRVSANQRIPIINSHVYLLQTGQAKLLGVGKTEAISAGRIIKSDTDGFDILWTNTVCTVLLAPVSAYEAVIKGRFYDSDSDNEPTEHIIPVNSSVDWNSNNNHIVGEPTRKRARKAVDERLSGIDVGCTELRLEGKWEYGDAELSFICNNLHNLRNLTVSDWSFALTKESLLELQRLKYLETLKLVNVEAVDDCVIQSLPTSLTKLDVSYCHRINDFGSFGHLKRLESLTMTRCSPTTTTSPLPKTLTSLVLAECHLMTDNTLIKAITELQDLKHLDLSFCESIKDIQIVGHLKAINSLKLKSVEAVNDVSLKRLLDALGSVEHLDVSYNHNLHDLASVVCQYNNLKTVLFDHCQNIDQRQAYALSALFTG